MRAELLHGFRQFDETKKLTPELSAIIKKLPLSSVFGMTPSSTSNARSENLMCLVCDEAVLFMGPYIDTHTRDEVVKLVVQVCGLVTDYSEEECTGAIELHIDTVLYIYKNARPPPGQVCGIVLQDYDCSIDDPIFQWTVDIDYGLKQEVKKTDNRKADVQAADPLKIVHMTDIHYNPPNSPDGNTDPQMQAFEDTLQQIKTTNQKLDYIYITGDLVGHAVWNTTIKLNAYIIQAITRKVQEYFPKTPLYQVLGNHEPSPINQFAPYNITDETVSTKWLYDLAYNLWSDWLPEETKETVLRGGFYTVLVKPGFRIIGLNSNLCYIQNWWTIYSPKDIDGQLQWLADTLLKAEKAGEKVHILTHIPTWSSCLRTWSREFRRITDRFSDTVTAIFNGHTHGDHFNVYYSVDRPTRAIGMAINGASVTPIGGKNSNYKVYTIDSATLNILNSECWVYNPPEANENPCANPNWTEIYSFKDVFELQSMSAIDMETLTHKLAKKHDLLGFYGRGKDPCRKCDDTTCQKNALCSIAQTQVGDNAQCDELLREYDDVYNVTQVPLY